MNFLFDIGRVLLDFDFETSLSKLLPDKVDHPRQRLECLLTRKDDFESGAIDPDAYIEWALDIMESEAGPDEFIAAWRDIFTPNQPMWARVRQLHSADHKLILFSNTNAIHVPWIFETWPEFELFHGDVLSFEVGQIKPHPAIYQYAIEHHGLSPSETLYIDDLPENIEAGRAAGFNSWQYELNNHQAFELWLDKALQQADTLSP